MEKKSLAQLAAEFDLEEMSTSELTALLSALGVRYDDGEGKDGLISRIRNGASSGGKSNGVETGVLRRNIRKRLDSSDMRQSTMMQATHLQKQADEAEQRAQQLETEVSLLVATRCARGALIPPPTHHENMLGVLLCDTHMHRYTHAGTSARPHARTSWC